MQFDLATPRHRHTITGYGDGYVQIHQTRYPHPILLQDEREVINWTSPATGLIDVSQLDLLVDLNTRCIILGTGSHLIWADTTLTQKLAIKGIGLETMNTPAACRTYNILVGENRSVAAILFPPLINLNTKV